MTTITNPKTGKVSYVYSPVELEEFRLRQLTAYQLKHGEKFSKSPGSVIDRQSSAHKKHTNRLA